ncbi:MAG: hypothetical protein MUF54_25625 [Polyangiaceae bacterium]|jgi:hypothetical protein|nr:hypothetical protein [Polyangiaceae bacterium]
MQSLLHAAREGVLVTARPDLRGLVVTGPDRTSWLNGMITSDLLSTQRGDAVYGLALNKQGKILTDIIALEHAGRLLLAADASGLHETLAHLNHFLIMEDAEIESWSEPHAWVVAFGPWAARLVQLSRATASSDVAAASGPILGYPAAAFAVRGGADDAAQRIAALAPEHAVACSSGQLDAVRVALGIPRFGVDFTQANYPMDVGLDERAISFNKGCYLGQEVVVKLRSRGKPVRTLKRLSFSPDVALPCPGAPVRTEQGKDVGTVTSASRADPHSVGIAFALVRRADIQGATRVLAGEQPATLLDAWEWW